jgi:uncharacterized protein (TIGR02588 family)
MAARTSKRDARQRQTAGGKPATSAPGTADSREAQSIPLLEWIIGGIGFLIMAAVLGFLLFAAMMEDHPLPDVKLSVDAVRQIRNGYLVQITALNEGGSTAEGVVVEGELRNGTELIEQSRIEIEFLPPHSRKRAGLFFSRDPKQFELRLRPHGYEEP